MAELQDGIPLVSCVIPFLNGEKFIGATIESVLAQTWSNWELILVNDGTTDGAADIARRYCAAHPDRIRCISHPGGRNLGPGASRNAGVREARGAYLAFVDADDIWLPERLEAHVAMFERHPEAALVIGPTLRWSSWNGTDAAWWRPWQTLDEPNVLGLATDVVLRAEVADLEEGRKNEKKKKKKKKKKYGTDAAWWRPWQTLDEPNVLGWRRTSYSARRRWPRIFWSATARGCRRPAASPCGAR